jgi:sterol carrier protein 2
MKVFVVGVGMTRFEKPGRKKDWDYTDYVLEAASKALIDSNLTYDNIQFAATGYCFGKVNFFIIGDSTCGQRALYQLGLTQIPVVNVNNKYICINNVIVALQGHQHCIWLDKLLKVGLIV